jgi:hypothetical protein
MMRESRMPDYPSAATAAAIEAIRGEYPMITPAMLSGLATLALDAAAPLLADPVARAITHQIRGWAGSFVAADPAVASLVAELLRVLDGIAPAAKMVAHGDEPYRQVKDFAALPWAAEHVIRGHEAWPGL